jgi:hypothetical protein
VLKISSAMLSNLKSSVLTDRATVSRVGVYLPKIISFPSRPTLNGELNDFPGSKKMSKLSSILIPPNVFRQQYPGTTFKV